MAQVQISRSSSSETIRPNVRLIVRTRFDWADEWKTNRYLYPVSATHTVAPGMGTARFRYEYGRIRQPGASSFSTPAPQDLEGYFVQIKIAGGPVLWTGIITSEAFDLHGNDAADPSGNQDLMAVSMGHILDRHTITFGYIDQFGAGSAEGIGWLPGFNKRHDMGLSLAGNRTNARIAADGGAYTMAHAFSDDGAVWTNLDIVEYLLARHFPPGFEIALSGQYEELDHETGEHYLEGLSIWQCIEHLISWRQGLGWTLDVGSDDKLYVHVFSVLGDPISVGDVTTPANAEQVELPDINSIGIERAVLKMNKQTQFDRILVLGERIKTCCTLSWRDGTIEAGWTTAEQDLYKEPRGALANDAEMNDNLRKTDQYARVFQMFRAPRLWDFTAGGGTDEHTRIFTVPRAEPDGTIEEDAEATSFIGGKAFLRHTLFEETAGVPGAEKEFLPPMAFLRSFSNKVTHDGGVYECTGNHTSGAWDTDSQHWNELPNADSDGLTAWSAGVPYVGSDTPAYFEVNNPSKDDNGVAVGAMKVAVTDREMGITVRAADIPHQLARSDFSSSVYFTDTLASYDWRDLIFTVAFESDERIGVVATTDDSVDEDKVPHPRTLTIDVEGAEAWYIVPNTVEKIDWVGADGVTTLVRYVDQTYPSNLLRDDSAHLRFVAAMAKAWYGQTRAELQLSCRRINDMFALGSYIKNVGDSVDRNDVGTVVTEKSWNFTGSPTSSIKTGYSGAGAGRIDFPGLSGPRAVAREIRRMRRDVRDLRSNLGNLPVRVPSGGGGSSSDIDAQRITWNED